MITYNRNSVEAPDWLVDARVKKQNDEILLQLFDDTINAQEEAKRKNPSKKVGIVWPGPVKTKLKNCKYLLEQIFHRKCAYCETKRYGYGNVEHFRPKAITKYWWLALTWENLLFSCERCNQSYKKTEYPLGPGSMRADKPGNNLYFENNIIINPLDEDPETLIAYRNDGDLVRLVSETSLSSLNRDRVTKYIELLKLNDDDHVNEARREIHGRFVSWFFIYSKSASLPADRHTAEIELRKMASDNAECAGMIRYFLRKRGLSRLIP